MSLFADLEQVFSFLVQRLPSDLSETISSTLLPDLINRIISVWLDSAVPASLQGMDKFQNVIAAARDFCSALRSLGLSNLRDLQEWTESAPKVWLFKCREMALDSVRTKLSQGKSADSWHVAQRSTNLRVGLGASTRIERVEKQRVSRSEGKQLAANGAVPDIDDHGWDAWDDEAPEAANGLQEEAEAKQNPAEGDEDGADAWGWSDGDAGPSKQSESPIESKPMEEEDPAEAWGWGDEANDDGGGEIEAKQKPPPSAPVPGSRELTFKETYSISAMPQPVLDLIFAVIEDGAALTRDTYATSPVAAAAAGLLSLPTLALAMFRAVSPYYYASDIGGNM